MSLHRDDYFNLAKAAINTAIKNSDLASPYMSQSSYQKALLALNGLYFALHLATAKTNTPEDVGTEDGNP